MASTLASAARLSTPCVRAQVARTAKAVQPVRVSLVSARSVPVAPAPSVRIGAPRQHVCSPTHATASPQAGSTPVVKIDNISDPFATVVTVELGDQLGELLETITALKNLGLNIRRAKLAGQRSALNSFFITEAETSDKVVKSARLEEIRMTVINSLMTNYPESAAALGAKASVDSDARPLGMRKKINTTIEITEASNGACSILKLVTKDRAGLLVDIVRVLKDVNLNVVSAEVDTKGGEAHDEFFLTYHGEPLSPPMQLLVTNALQYYLSLAEVANDQSY